MTDLMPESVVDLDTLTGEAAAGAPDVLDAVDDMAPVITVDRHAMNEQRHRALTALEIGDAAGFDLGKAAAPVKRLDVHGLLVSLAAETF